MIAKARRGGGEKRRAPAAKAEDWPTAPVAEAAPFPKREASHPRKPAGVTRNEQLELLFRSAKRPPLAENSLWQLQLAQRAAPNRRNASAPRSHEDPDELGQSIRVR